MPIANTVVVPQREKERKTLKRKCREFCTTKWTEMRLRTQIILKLLLIIVLLFTIYIIVLVVIFEFYYKPDVLGHFKQELESVHALRTSNMTVSISSRFEAFDNLTYDNVAKMRSLLATTQVDGYDPDRDLPFNYIRELYPYCTKGVTNEHQYLVRNFEPLWVNLLTLKLGWQTNLEMQSILILFKEEGICAFYNDEKLQKERIEAFNKLPNTKFTHSIFDSKDPSIHLRKETNQLGETS